MACVTLKRSLDFDPLHCHGSPKRRRCSPNLTPRPSAATNVKIGAERNAQHNQVFSKVTPNLSTEAIAAQISAEIKRMQHRRQLKIPSSSLSSPLHVSTSSQNCSHQNPQQCQCASSQKYGWAGSASGQASPGRDSGSDKEMDASEAHDHQLPSPGSAVAKMFGALSPAKKDIPLFTFRQVSHICERLLKEREETIKEKYDEALADKMSEQYEAFLKFNHDMLQRRFSAGAAPSYVS